MNDKYVYIYVYDIYLYNDKNDKNDKIIYNKWKKFFL